MYNSTVAQPFTVSGWAIDTAHPTGTGVSDVHIYGCVASNCVWEFWGAATYGIARPDVAAAFGHVRFTNSGFSLAVSGNPAGLHLIQVWAFDTVTGTWQGVATQATLLTAPAQSITTINTPTNQQAVTQPFSLSGWAIDWGATSGTGVDIVGGWTYPNPGSGQPSVSLGATTYGGSRPDVGASHGAQFLNSGFQKSVSGLVAGPHVMGVSAHSTVSGIWHGKSVPLVFIDMPTSALTIDRPGTGTGAVTASGLSCPGGAATVAVPCGATYTSQTVVTLTAVADTGSTFGGWGGACSGTGTCQVTMAGAKLVTATFVKTAATVTTRYYHTDIIGSVRAITKENGDVDTRHDYRPFGEDTQPLDGDPNRFAGKQLDPETALHYFDARYYRQTWGRFTQVDPLHVGAAMTNPQRWNRYAYAGNNPLRFVDPTGLSENPVFRAENDYTGFGGYVHFDGGMICELWYKDGSMYGYLGCEVWGDMSIYPTTTFGPNTIDGTAPRQPPATVPTVGTSQSTLVETIQTVINVVSVAAEVSVVGAPLSVVLDGFSALLSFWSGDSLGGWMSVGAMVPGFGMSGNLARMGRGSWQSLWLQNACSDR